MQILDAGSITLGNGKRYDMSGFYIVFTSNIGYEYMLDMDEFDYESAREAVMLELHDELRPEFCNRFSEIVVFKKLFTDAQIKIAELVMTSELKRFSEKGIILECTEEVLQYLIRIGVDEQSGARNLRNTIEGAVQSAIANNFLAQKPLSGTLQLKDDEIYLEPFEIYANSMIG